jgi:O-methyltransferase
LDTTAFPVQDLGLRIEGKESILSAPGLELAYRLNAVGTAIARQLQQPVLVSAIARRLSRDFDVAAGATTSAVEAFLERWRALGLIDLIPDASPDPSLRRRYLDLLKRALVNLIYPEHELRIEELETNGVGDDSIAHERRLRDIRYLEAHTFADLLEHKRLGSTWRKRVTRFSHTMIGLRRLDNLDYCAASVFANDTPGDFLEAGVCQGGASVFLRGLQVAHGQSHRRTWVADSFRGLPASTATADVDHDFAERRFPWLAASVTAVQDNFRTYGLLSGEVRFLEGWFSETLPQAPVEQLAILRIDADLYSSTRDVLASLHDRVSPGGFVIIDEYSAFEPCRRAVDDFRREHAIDAPLRRVDGSGVYWQMPK